MDKSLYNTQFYINNRNDKKRTSVEVVLSEVIKVLPKIDSAVDFGCGVGTWLAELQKLGVKEIKGFDGPWVKKNLLTIPADSFVETNLEKGITLDKKYDLAISIEVAEHLPESSAVLFIESLTQASDIILFSAAIPFQGGANHMNEQWPDYWYKLLNERGYVAIDFLRKRIWNDQRVLSFHRQNIILYVKKEKENTIKIPKDDSSYPPMAIVHPEFYLSKQNILKRIIKSILGQRLVGWLKR